MSLYHGSDRLSRLFSLVILAVFGLALPATEVIAAKWIVVSVSEAPIQIGDRTIGMARRAERFEVIDEQDGFYKVEFTDPGGQPRRGWISWRSVAVGGGGPNTGEVVPADEQQLWAESLELHRKRRFAEALPVAERLVSFHDKGDRRRGPLAADALYLLARIQGELQQYGKAKQRYDEALLTSLDVNGPAAYRTLACLAGLAEVAHAEEQVSLRRHCMRLCYQKRNVLGGVDGFQSHAGVVTRNVLKDASDRVMRIAAQDDADGAALWYSGQDQPISEQMLLSLGGSSAQMAATRQEINSLRRAIRPPANSRLAEAEYLTDLALLLGRLGHAERAQDAARHAGKLRRQESGENSTEYADSLHVLAILDLARGRLDASCAHCRESLNRLGGLQADTCPAALVLHTWMLAECRAGRLAEAQRCGRAAQRIYTAQLGESHPDVSQCRADLAAVCVRRQNATEALRLYDLAVRGHHAQAVAQWTLPVDQLAARSPHNSGAVAFAVENSRRKEIVELSAEWLMNFKGLLTERQAEDNLQSRATARIDSAFSGINPRNPAAFQQFQQRAVQLIGESEKASLLHQAVLGRRESLLRWTTSEQIAAMQRSDQRLRDMMTDILSMERPKRRQYAWVTLPQVRKCLPANAWLVEFARYQIVDATTGEESSRYAAWVIPPASRGDVRIVPLGPARDIEPLVDVAWKTGGNLRRIASRGEKAAEAAWRDDATRLAKRVLWPVLKHVPEDGRRLLLAPDSALWNVPWCALPLPDGRYAIEERQIDYVASERSLIARSQPTADTGPAVIFAAPDYEASLGEVAELAWEKVRKRLFPMGLYTRATGMPHAPPLPGTLAEAEVVAPYLRRMTGVDPIQYTDKLASEGIFLSLQSPHTLVLSTHGYYHDRPFVVIPDRYNFSEHDQKRELTSPLQHCGLIMAGFNRNRDAEFGVGNETSGMLGDGVLTGDEIVRVDLSATELVVLSACKTAVGHHAKNGEVESLRQSFHIAGAQRVVATLWPIPDKETVPLMRAFFKRLADRQRPEDALRDAQLETVRLRRQRHGAAHPAYWAAFGMTLNRMEPSPDSGPPSAAETQVLPSDGRSTESRSRS